MRRLVFTLLVLNWLLLPLTCIPAVYLLNTVNPMQLVFITGFRVANHTASSVYVTPIGAVGHEGRRHPLPMTTGKSTWAPGSQRGRFPIRSGETITLYYDWDDINFSELVVEAEDGQLRQLVVNPTPKENQYSIPKESEFVIDDLTLLSAVDPDVREAYATAQRPERWWLFLAVSASPAISFLPLRRWYRRLKDAEAAGPVKAGTEAIV